MASRTGNDAVLALRARQEVERRAVRAVEQSAAVLAEAEHRRREALARLDAERGDAAAAHDLAVVVLATLLRDDGLAAELAGVDVGRVRALRRSVDRSRVRERVEALGSVVPRRRRASGAGVGPVDGARPVADLGDGD
ncbi:hypothetical protein [Micromonospora sp. SH-82]|uniref:hypothetical protein n=1 Tax=Micromonospora sp. SH-82 TaxID=3132938 RepID=UPI003EBB9CFE